MRGLIAVLILLGAGSVAPGAAQVPIPIPTPTRDTSRADTVEVPRFRIAPPIAPLAAFGRSLLLPGWGQAALGRRGTGAVFVFWEGLTLTMMLKARHQLGYLERIEDDERIDAKRQEVQDWTVLLVFNHLIAGAEAFVASQLWDFPVELETRALPSGAAALGARIPWPGGVSERRR